MAKNPLTENDLIELLRIVHCNSGADPKHFKETLAVLLMSTWKEVEDWGSPVQKRMSKVGWRIWKAIEDLPK